MQEPVKTETKWVAEIGPQSTVVVARGEGLEPLTFDNETAARLAISLLAVSVVNKGPAQRPPVGTKIEGVHFPVIAWSIGRSSANGEPVLLVTVPGGTVLMLQLSGGSAVACAQALLQEARAVQIPPGLKPN